MTVLFLNRFRYQSSKVLSLSLKCISYLLIVLFSSTVSADVVETTNYYSIVASNEQELDAQLSLKSRNGFHADTKWTIQPRYRFKKIASGCEVSDSIVNLTITYTMPQWLNKEAAPTVLQERWHDWYANLLAHEKNHGHNGRQAYRYIKHGINTAGHAQTCLQLTDALKNMIDGILFKYSQEDQQYDLRTKHGATEGATISFSNNK